jgi:hypothetical protein
MRQQLAGFPVLLGVALGHDARFWLGVLVEGAFDEGVVFGRGMTIYI